VRQRARRAAGGLRIIVLGYIVRGPLGGLTWHHLQYVLGLAALGHTVHFLEDSGDYPSCYDPSLNVTGADPSYGLRYAADVFARAGMPQCWAFHDAIAGAWHGPRAGDMQRLCREADLVLNLSGVNPLRDWLRGIPSRVLVDTDPVFTQVRHLMQPDDMDTARRHTAFFTFGENFGQPDCTMPDDGLPWQPTRQPVVLDQWAVSRAARIDAPFTTVMQWDSYPALEYQGARYGMKSDSFGAFRALPSRVAPALELALGGSTAPRRELGALGWSLRDPLEVTRDPWTFQSYLRDSRAEFSLAKHGYVVTRSGWFSERSAGYLASGKPVVVQQTGFSDWLPTGEGVLAFADLEEAVAAIGDVEARYCMHCEAARAIAETSFDSRTVLARLVESAVSVERAAQRR
jgi:hypothetical protein